MKLNKSSISNLIPEIDKHLIKQYKENDILVHPTEYATDVIWNINNDDNEIMENENENEHTKENISIEPLLIRIYGNTTLGHSICVNVLDYKPYYFVGVPSNFTKVTQKNFIKELKESVYYKFKDGLLKWSIVNGKPLESFTGDDIFSYFKLEFANDKCADQYMFKLQKTLKFKSVLKGTPIKYKIYESKINPIMRLIHDNDLQASSWFKINCGNFEIVDSYDRTSSTDIEINVKWNLIYRANNVEIIPKKNIAAFDIEADSSHGDFPVANKNYRKVAQELITIYNEHSIHQSIKSKRNSILCKYGFECINKMLHLIFNEFYSNYCIHHVYTTGNIKPSINTINYLSNKIYDVFYDYFGNGADDRNDIFFLNIFDKSNICNLNDTYQK